MEKPALMLPDAAPAGSVGQGLLFSREIEILVEAEERKGVYTAERFRQKEPRKYAAVVELSARHWGQLRIAQLLGIHHRTVAAVQLEEPESIDIARSKMANALRQAAWLQLERLLEHPDTVPMNVSGLILSQLLDKAELLDGRATQRVEHVERVDIYDDWDRFIEENLEPKQLGTDEVREIPAKEIGSDAGNLPAIGKADDGAPLRVGAPRAGSDSLSLVSNAPAQVSDDDATDPATDPADSESETRGEGVPENRGGGPKRDLSRRPENF